MSNEVQLPTGWAWCSLADVGILHCGQSPAVSQVNHDSVGTPYITGPDQWDGTSLSVDKWTTHPKRTVPDGCIFITVKGAGVGTIFPGVACAIGRDVYAYEPAGELSRKFIEYSLRFNIAQVLRHAKGDIPGLSKGHILGHITAFPPLAEQRRIVAKIEELFSDLDAGVAALERAKANLKRYRAAVLKAAVEGKLTEAWRAEHPHTEPASKLLERILAERRRKWEADQLAKFAAAGKEPPKNWQAKYVEPTPPDITGLPELPEGWCWASVEQLSVVVRGASPRPAGDPKFFGGPIPWITVGSLTTGEQPYLYSVTEGLTEAGKEASRWIEPDTLLLTNSGATLGVPKITMIGGCINDGSVALLDVDYPLKLYLYYFLKSQTKRLRQINQGAAQPNLNTGIVKAIAVPLCSIGEQQKIVLDLAERFSQIKAAETTIEHGLLRAARLRQSILKQAFEGKLVPQDPTDEPASVLLERLRDQRGTINVVPPSRRGRRKADLNTREE